MKDKRKSDPDKLGRRGYVNADIEKTTYQKLVSEAEQKNISMRKYLTFVLNERFEKEEMIKKISPKLSMLELSENSIVIRDDHIKQPQFAVIEIREDRLWCELDKDFDCQHIRLVLTSPRLSELKDKLKHI